MKTPSPEKQPSSTGRWLPEGILEPSLLFVPFLLGWAYFVWTSYLPKGLGEIAPGLKALFRIPLPPVWKPWWLDFFGVLLLSFAALCIGGWLVDRARLELSRAERLLVGTTTGFMALILAASALSLLRWFSVWPLRILVLLFVLLAIPRARAEAQRLRQLARSAWDALKRHPVNFWYAGLVGMFFCFAFIGAAAPEGSFDALNVHLYYPRLFLQEGYFYRADLFRSTAPLYAQVLYAIGLALDGPHFAKFLNFLFLPGLLLCTFVLVRALMAGQERSVSAGLLGALFVVSCPTVLHHAGICYPDLAAAFFGAVAFYAVIRFLGTSGNPWLWFAGVAAGFAMGTKYAGLYIAAILAVVLFVGAACRQRLRSGVRVAVCFGVLAAAIGSPWYVRNWYYTGDPLHPAMYKFLKNPVIDPVEAADLIRDAMNSQRFSFSARNLLALPWLLTMNGHQLQGTIGPVFLWALPLVLLSATRSLAWMMTAVAAVAFSLLWFAGPQWLRYFLPGIPLLAALAARATYHPRHSPPLRGLWAAIAVAFALVNLPGLNDAWVSGGNFVVRQLPYQVVFGRQSEDEYMRATVFSYDAAQYLDRLNLPPETRVLRVGESFLPFLSRYPVIDVLESGRIVCYNERGEFIGCYRLSSYSLRANMDRHQVGLLSMRHDAILLRERRLFSLEHPFLRTDFKFLAYVGGCFLYQRQRGGPVPGLPYVNADLLYRFATHSGVRGSDPFDMRVAEAQPAGGDVRPGLIMLPPNELTYRVRFGMNPQLSFALGMSAKAAAGAAGIDLNISVRSKLGESEVVFTQRFLPHDAAKGWMPFTVDLSAYSGQECVLTFQTTPVAPGVRDWLAISDPVIYAIETGAPVLLPEEPYEFEPASLKNPVQIRFSPDRVRSGIDVYTIEIAGMANVTVDLLYSYRGGLAETAEKFCRLDAKGRATVPVPAGIRPGVVRVKGVRPSGQDLWLAADGTIEVIP